MPTTEGLDRLRRDRFLLDLDKYAEYYYDPTIAALSTLLILFTIGLVQTDRENGRAFEFYVRGNAWWGIMLSALW